MKRFILFSFAIAFFINVFSQQSCDKFLIKFSGKKICDSNIGYKNPLFGESYFIINNLKISSDSVKFYVDENGEYANCMYAGNKRHSKFYGKMDAGRVNIWGEIVRINGSRRIGYYYYNMGLNDLQPIKYNNLLEDLKSSNDAQYHLKHYRIRTIVGRTLLISGTSLMVIACMPKFSPEAGASLFLSGLSFDITGFIVYFNRYNSLVKALKAYNKSFDY